MIIKEIVEIDGVQYDHTYSDAGFMIEREGVQYADAVDPLNSGRIYTETDMPVEDNSSGGGRTLKTPQLQEI